MRQALTDFEPLLPAEGKLRDWLLAGNRGFCVIARTVPGEKPDDAQILRASFLRYLALGGCEGCALPETGLQVWGAFIQGDDRRGEETQGLDLEGALLPGDLALVACRIPDQIVLRSARVKSLFLNDSHLARGISADGMQAEGSVFLRGAQIAGAVRLLGARVGGDLSCNGARLTATGKALHCDGMQAEGGVFLRGAQIAGAVRLLGARLGGNLDCERAKLTATGDALHCDGMQAEGDVFLREAQIAGAVRLLGVRLGGDLDCGGAALRGTPKSLIANNAAIIGRFFLREGARVSGAVDLTGAQIGTICDDPACWPPELLLDRCRYGAFVAGPVDAAARLRWLALQKPQEYRQDFWPDSYEHCARVLQEAGHGADSRAILIEKERLQRKARRAELWRSGRRLRVPALWLRDFVLNITVRYGRQPLLAFVWLAGFVLLGWGIFAYTAQQGQIKPNLPLMQRAPEWVGCADGGALRRSDQPTQLACFLAQPQAASYPRFSPFIYSADTLFPVVSLEMQSYWIPDDSQPIGRWARIYLWLHIALGWGLTLLAVAGFSGLIKTDSGK